LGKLRTVEIIIRGDIIERDIIIKLANKLRESGLRADFSSSIAVPACVKGCGEALSQPGCALRHR
jgi:hypothetical protein